jgi:hypothetical protein
VEIGGAIDEQLVSGTLQARCPDVRRFVALSTSIVGGTSESG